jgi:Leucine-rich repeat (LRR) protein
LGSEAVDAQAMSDLFHCCGGRGWKKKINWGSDQPVSLWHGVKTESRGSRVTSINLAHNGLHSAFRSDSFGGGLAKMKYLNLSRNELTELPTSLGQLVSLESLVLHGNQLQSLPDSMDGMTSLTALSLGNSHGKGNPITQLPDSICNMSWLKKIRLANNTELQNLPTHIGKMASLEIIECSNCIELRFLPDSIGYLQSLVELNCVGCSLEALPESIGLLQSLQYLDISENSLLSAFPESIGFLQSLRVLVCVSCGLQTLPDSIGELSSLETLKLGDVNTDRGNPIEKFPNAAISSLGSLLLLDFSGCPLKMYSWQGKQVETALPHCEIHWPSPKVSGVQTDQAFAWSPTKPPPQWRGVAKPLRTLSITLHELDSLPCEF